MEYTEGFGSPPGQPRLNVESGNTLFMDSTISTDDTVGDLSKKREMLSNFHREPGEGLKWMGSSQSNDAASPGKTIKLGPGPARPVPGQPTPPPVNTGGQPASHPPPILPAEPDNGRHSSSSGDDSDASDDHSSSRWPKTQAYEHAQWRQNALAKRARSRGMSTGNNPGSKECSDLQVCVENGKGVSGSENCEETRVALLATNEFSDSTKVLVPQGLNIASSPQGLARNTPFASEALPVCSDSFTHGSRRLPETQPDSQHDQALNSCQPTLSESLHAITEKFLGIDVLEEKQDVSRFIAYLLDTIELLDGRLAFSKAGEASRSESPFSEHQSLQSQAEHSNVFIGQVLHRILCGKRSHQHDQSYYEDRPTYKDQNAGDEAKLVGEILVHSLEDYVDEHPNTCFLVIKDHVCTRYPAINKDHAGGESRRQNLGPGSEKLRVVAPLLQKALLEVAEYYPIPGVVPVEHFFEHEGIEAPYPFLFHHQKELVQLSLNETYKSVLDPLLEFLDKNYTAEYEEASSLFKRGFVTANHMTKLFKPNQIVISRDKSNVLEAHVLTWCHPLGKDAVTLVGWSWSYDGNELKRQGWRTKIDGVPGEEIRITDLGACPVDFARAEDISGLEKRGKGFWSMRDQAYICYTGWDMDRQHHYTGERFMVDVATYKLMHPEPWAPKPFQPANRFGIRERLDPWPVKVDRTEELPEKASMLLPGTIFGFRLRAKKWTNLLVENFHSMKWNPEAFGRLVLDDAVKKMIRALVDVQKSAGKMDDIIAGKGNGLIILLHGSPGTGKTLTAESVAEIAEKPLYRVTCGDIGTDPKDVEKYLETVLYLGKIWDCVLLLDEADVFLEERTMADLRRNSLVSIFLRTLEYYDGILILTSNRVGTFDEAFKSRIQVAIHYDNLTKKSRRKIWRNFFDMIEESEDEDANMAELERRLDDLAAYEMNGRQIRNVLLTARQLAKYEEERLDWKHLSQAIKTAAEFNKYLKTVKGHSDEQWAREEMLR